MKALLICLILASSVLPLCAQTDSAVEAERARIAAERKQADARFASQEVACYQKFGVNDCLNAARAQRRERLADLRRQEISLNDAERRRRAAERLRSIEEKNSARKQEDSAAERVDAAARQRERQEEIARRAAERARPRASEPARESAGKPQARGPASSSPAPKAQRAHDSAEALRRHEERQKEAQERRERVAKRLAEPRKPEIKPLPVPP